MGKKYVYKEEMLVIARERKFRKQAGNRIHARFGLTISSVECAMILKRK